MQNYNIVIEDSIPIPERVQMMKQFPFEQLKVGQSFWVPVDRTKMSKLINMRQKRGYYKSKRFIFKTEVKNGVLGSRCWRYK